MRWDLEKERNSLLEILGTDQYGIQEHNRLIELSKIKQKEYEKARQDYPAEFLIANQAIYDRGQQVFEIPKSFDSKTFMSQMREATAMMGDVKFGEAEPEVTVDRGRFDYGN